CRWCGRRLRPSHTDPKDKRTDYSPQHSSCFPTLHVPLLCEWSTPSLLDELDVFQVCEKAGDHPWERILRNIFGVHRGFGKQPEHGHFRKLGKFIVPDLPQQPCPCGRVDGLTQGFHALVNKGMLKRIDHAVFAFVENPDKV